MSEEHCLRQLKYWAILGIDADTKASHKSMWADVDEAAALGELPSTEQLDRMVADMLDGGYP